jgi:hypothetical protein
VKYSLKLCVNAILNMLGKILVFLPFNPKIVLLKLKKPSLFLMNTSNSCSLTA